jgi:cytochrome c oxidase subunit IV
MNKTIERYVNYLLLTGFFLLGAGLIVSIIEQIRSGMPIELAMILSGLVLIVLCFIIAKIFG